LEAQGHLVHKRFPERLAFTLNNRVRRLLEPPDRLVSQLGLKATDVVVDFGCGPGFYTIPIARGAARTIAVDVSSHMLEKTVSNAKKNQVTVEALASDGTAIKLDDGIVDLIFLSHVFHEVANRPKVLSEFLRIMKRSGRLAIVEKTRGGLLAWAPGPPIIDQAKIVQELERAGFRFTQIIPYGSNSIVIGKKP
jgi:ubiquinone/menaquinone biosynthesis C-methylase UbiE